MIAKLEKLLDDVAVPDGDLLEADEPADPVVHVDDEVAHLEIAQVGEECRRQRPLAVRCRPAPFLLEDVRFGVELESGVGKTEAAREQPFGDEHRALDTLIGLRRRQRPDVVVAQQFHGALGPAVRARHEQDRFPAIAALPKIRDPIRDAPLELLRGLHGDVQCASLAFRGRSLGRFAVDGQFLEPHTGVEHRADLGPGQHQLGR